MANILIIDDEPGYRDPLRTMLSLEGYQVRAAAGGTEAIELAADFQPDLVIVDWMLRDQRDGIDVVLALRVSNPQLKTIVITGYPTASLEARVHDILSCQFLAKPFTLNELRAAIRVALSPAEHEE